MFQKFLSLVGGNPNKREVERLTEKILPVNDFESQYEKLSDEDLREKTVFFRGQLADRLKELPEGEVRQAAEQAFLDEILPKRLPQYAKHPNAPLDYGIMTYS